MKNMHASAIIVSELGVIHWIIMPRLVETFSTQDGLELQGVMDSNINVRVVRMISTTLNLPIIGVSPIHSQVDVCTVIPRGVNRQIAATVHATTKRIRSRMGLSAISTILMSIRSPAASSCLALRLRLRHWLGLAVVDVAMLLEADATLVYLTAVTWASPSWMLRGASAGLEAITQFKPLLIVRVLAVRPLARKISASRGGRSNSRCL